MRLCIVFLTCFFSTFAFCQQRVPFVGRFIYVGESDEYVVVENRATHQRNVVNSKGIFTIIGQVGDTLRFTNITDKSLNHVLNDTDEIRGEVLIPIEGKVKNKVEGKVLDEIFINKFDAKRIGLDFSNLKRYTPIEKRIYSASKVYSLENPLAVSVDGIINSLNGKHKMLKKALVYETNASNSEKLFALLSVDVLKAKFAIGEEYVDGFLYFLADDTEIISILGEAQVSILKLNFRVTELALVFKDKIVN